MSEIKKGDLVMVVRGRACGCPGRIGLVRRVVKIEMSNKIIKCNDCGKSWVALPSSLWNDHACELYRLRKINPPATGELDGVPVRKTEPKEVMV